MMEERKQAVYALFSGRCAYCGTPIAFDEVKIDHLTVSSLCGTAEVSVELEKTSEKIAIPTCPLCSSFSKLFPTPDGFRKTLENTFVPSMKESYSWRLAERFGLVESHEKPVRFFYEDVLGKEDFAEKAEKEASGTELEEFLKEKFSTEAQNVILTARIFSVAELAEKVSSELLSNAGCTVKIVSEIKEALNRYAEEKAEEERG